MPQGKGPSRATQTKPQGGSVGPCVPVGNELSIQSVACACQKEEA